MIINEALDLWTMMLRKEPELLDKFYEWKD
jgi:hypothetical protein